MNAWNQAAIIALLVVAGCAKPVDREELTTQVLQADPEFSSVLAKHRELINRIETHGQELALKRSSIEHGIQQLRQELAQAAASVKEKTAELKKRIDPDRERLQLALTMSTEELRAKQLQRAGLGRSVTKLRKAAKNADANWTSKERSQQEREVDDRQRDMARLDQEMTAIKEHIRLLKIKLLLIKL